MSMLRALFVCLRSCQGGLYEWDCCFVGICYFETVEAEGQTFLVRLVDSCFESYYTQLAGG
jgi:hypothetical protein